MDVAIKYDAIPYRSLQKMAKHLKIPANYKKKHLVDLIVAQKNNDKINKERIIKAALKERADLLESLNVKKVIKQKVHKNKILNVNSIIKPVEAHQTRSRKKRHDLEPLQPVVQCTPLTSSTLYKLLANNSIPSVNIAGATSDNKKYRLEKARMGFKNTLLQQKKSLISKRTGNISSFDLEAAGPSRSLSILGDKSLIIEHYEDNRNQDDTSCAPNSINEIHNYSSIDGTKRYNMIQSQSKCLIDTHSPPSSLLRPEERNIEQDIEKTLKEKHNDFSIDTKASQDIPLSPPDDSFVDISEYSEMLKSSNVALNFYESGINVGPNDSTSLNDSCFLDSPQLSESHHNGFSYDPYYRSDQSDPCSVGLQSSMESRSFKQELISNTNNKDSHHNSYDDFMSYSSDRKDGFFDVFIVGDSQNQGDLPLPSMGFEQQANDLIDINDFINEKGAAENANSFEASSLLSSDLQSSQSNLSQNMNCTSSTMGMTTYELQDDPRINIFSSKGLDSGNNNNIDDLISNSTIMDVSDYEPFSADLAMSYQNYTSSLGLSPLHSDMGSSVKLDSFLSFKTHNDDYQTTLMKFYKKYGQWEEPYQPLKGTANSLLCFLCNWVGLFARFDDHLKTSHPKEICATHKGQVTVTVDLSALTSKKFLSGQQMIINHSNQLYILRFKFKAPDTVLALVLAVPPNGKTTMMEPIPTIVYVQIDSHCDGDAFLWQGVPESLNQPGRPTNVDVFANRPYGMFEVTMREINMIPKSVPDSEINFNGLFLVLKIFIQNLEDVFNSNS